MKKVKLKQDQLIGDVVHKAGETVEVDDTRAAQMEHAGTAQSEPYADVVSYEAKIVSKSDALKDPEAEVISSSQDAAVVVTGEDHTPEQGIEKDNSAGVKITENKVADDKAKGKGK